VAARRQTTDGVRPCATGAVRAARSIMADTKTIFITGSASGLGKAAAKLFSSKGWRVLATMRGSHIDDEVKALPKCEVIPLDIVDLGQIEAAVQRAIELGGVDVVFNNAGYGLVGPLEGLSDDQIVRVINTNLLGTIRVTKAFIPHFRQKHAGLFINTTSIGGLIAFPYNSIYHATKWALEGWAEAMAFELKPLGIGMKSIEPGWIVTDFLSRSLDTGRHPAYDAEVEKMMKTAVDPKRMESASTPEQIADVVYEAATDGKDQLRYIAGADAKAMYAQRLQLGDEGFHQAIEHQFLG
jgi:NAD(P)-dependent dehydrogenase (short-subunit alcohol dehydrogenase family)